MKLTLGAVVLFFLAVTVNCQDPVVLTADGPVRGTYQQSYNGRTYVAFEGIPYAEPPVGSLRFEDPRPARPWTEVLNATTSYTCVQSLGIMVMGQEDCLYLNVYVPRDRIDPEDNLDVVVHVHGGAFLLGAPGFMAHPGLIMDRDVIFVSMNYRLGIFGFYSTGNGVSNGNFGLKDQTQSLRWIQNNIRNFGGNKDSVTLTGFSAGATSAHLHYFSPLSKGLFHKGFAQSGAALASWAIRRFPEVNARIVAETVGCAWQDIECLKGIAPAQLLTAIPSTGRISIDFGPTLEPESPTSFISEMPNSLLATNRVTDVPLLLSVVTEDGTVICEYLYNQIQYLEENWNYIIPILLDFDNHERQDEIAQQLREFYLQDRPVTAENFDQVVRLCTDASFHRGAAKSAKLQGSITSSGVYVLVMGYAGQAETRFGVSHGADGRFFFYNMPMGLPAFDADELKMKDALLDMLASLASTGVPKIEGVDFEPVPPSGDFDYLFVASPNDIAPRNGERLGEFGFWDSLGI